MKSISCSWRISLGRASRFLVAQNLGLHSWVHVSLPKKSSAYLPQSASKNVGRRPRCGFQPASGEGTAMEGIALRECLLRAALLPSFAPLLRGRPNSWLFAFVLPLLCGRPDLVYRWLQSEKNVNANANVNANTNGMKKTMRANKR